MNDETHEKREADQGLDDLEKHAHRSLWGIGFFTFLMLFAYFVKFSGYGFSGKQEDWGVFGDYVGGLLNPVISLAALYWLTRSIVLQKRELQESREALRETAFSQSQQAKSSEIAAKFQLLSIELEIISAQLAVGVNYQLQLLGDLKGSDLEQKIYDRKCELRPVKEILEEVQKEISRLTLKRESILRSAEKLAPNFKFEIMNAKSL